MVITMMDPQSLMRLLQCNAYTVKAFDLDRLVSCISQAQAKAKYVWWERRLGRAFQLYDETRIDHFRGFAGKI